MTTRARNSWLVGAITIVASVTAISAGAPAEAAPTLDLVAIEPTRLLETRVGPNEQTVDGLFESIGRVDPGSTTEVVVAGRGGVPATATAAFLNVTAVNAGGLGFLTVFPCGSPRPNASNVNYQPGETVPNAVLAKIGADGKVCIYSLAETDLIADANGFVPLGGSPESVAPARILETRDGPNERTVDRQFEGVGRIAARETLELDVAGRGGVPSDADGVFINLTAVAPSAPGFLTVFPCGSPRPTASNVNYSGGDVVPNVVLAKVGPDGRVCIYSLTETDMIVDVSGFVPNGRTPGTVVPARILETRVGSDLTTIDGRFEGIGVRAAGSTLRLDVAGRGGVPTDASAVFLNVTAVTPNAPGFVTVYPCGSDRPGTSNVNYAAGDVAPNSVLAKIGTDGQVCLFTLASTHLIVDVAGEVPQPSVKGLVDATAGRSHTCAIDDEDGVTCWGTYTNGELGVGSIDVPRSNSSLPITLTGISATEVHAGEFFTCALRSDGRPACWGRNTHGQLGDGTTIERDSPVVVGGLTSVDAVSVGRQHACALRSNGEVVCWGRNNAGQLGDGTKENSSVPVKVTGLPAGTTPVALDVGHGHSCVVMADGTGACWGAGTNNQLGAAGGSSTTPVVVDGLSGAVDIGAGQSHTCARLGNGSVQCWGAPDQIGVAGAVSTPEPQTVAGISGAVDLSVGYTTTCAALDDGSARCWGENVAGEVGNGVVGGGPEQTPVTVGGIDGDVVKVHASSGGRHTCATLADTSTVCFGTNADKQLGSITEGRQPSALPLIVGSSGLG